MAAYCVREPSAGLAGLRKRRAASSPQPHPSTRNSQLGFHSHCPKFRFGTTSRPPGNPRISLSLRQARVLEPSHQSPQALRIAIELGVGKSRASHLRMLAKQRGDVITGSAGPARCGLRDCRQDVGKRLLWFARQVERSIGSGLFQIAEDGMPTKGNLRLTSAAESGAGSRMAVLPRRYHAIGYANGGHGNECRLLPGESRYQMHTSPIPPRLSSG